MFFYFNQKIIYQEQAKQTNWKDLDSKAETFKSFFDKILGKILHEILLKYLPSS